LEEGTGTGVKWEAVALLHCVAELRVAELQFQTVSDIRGGSSQAGYGNAGVPPDLVQAGLIRIHLPVFSASPSFSVLLLLLLLVGVMLPLMLNSWICQPRVPTVILQTMTDAMIAVVL